MFVEKEKVGSVYLHVLIIYDSNAELKALKRLKKNIEANDVCIDLFSCTGNLLLQEELIRIIQNQGFNNINNLNSIQLIDDEIRCLREKICDWSAAVGDYKVFGKTIKEWFVLPGCDVSTWWFSLLSEKNALKTNAFFKLAQVNAIKKCLKEKKYDACVVVLKERILHQPIKEIVKKENITFHLLRVFDYRFFNKSKIKTLITKTNLFVNICFGFFLLFRLIIRGIYARCHLGKPAKRFVKSNSLLFVSYFPAIDQASAEMGAFNNKYAGILQHKLTDMKVQLTWLLMCVPVGGYSYYDAVKLARKFADNGEKLFILEEFINLQCFFWICLFWIRQIIVSIAIYPFIKKACFFTDPFRVEVESILKPLWLSSFCGYIGVEGITYFLLYKNAFKVIPNIRKCLYYCEMQAWEKGLNAAKKMDQSVMQTIAFQHSFVSRNHFFYFHAPIETKMASTPCDLPLPDVLACNGEVPFSLLSQCCYPGMIKVENVRHTYLNDILSCPASTEREKLLLLVAGSYDRTETMSLLSLVNIAFPKAQEIEICFKGHPITPFEDLFKEAGINVSEAGYIISHGDINECLKDAGAVLVPSSSVAVEALAFGCEVIIPVFSNAMLMNPLDGYEDYYHKVTNPEELRAVVESIVRGQKLKSVDEYREFVRKYWCLDPELPRWERLFEELVGRK